MGGGLQGLTFASLSLVLLSLNPIPPPRNSHFESQEAELRFWKGRAGNLQTTLRDTDATLKEFEESSKELEREMERELNAATTKASDLQLKAEKLKSDVDDWKGKYQRSLTDHNKSLAELNRELSTLRESHNVYKNKLRDMELDNDELENAERMVASSLTDMETRYNRAIERTALLEEELVEKSRLEEENQRLKDELQEVNEEMAVLRDRYDHRAGAMSRSDTRSAASADDSIVGLRPSSRLSDKPLSRPSGLSPPMPRSSLAPSATPSRPKTTVGRASAASHMRHNSADVRSTGVGGSNGNGSSSSAGMSSSPSSHTLRARQSISARPSMARTTNRAAPSAARNPGSSMQKMAGLLQNLRDLQATVQSATRITADVPSAIPRPSSRMSSASTVAATPRRSTYESRRDDYVSPSAIPMPSSGLSRSTSTRPSSRLSMSERPGSRMGMQERPSSRMGMQERPSSRLSNTERAPGSSHLPSSIRAQTPTFEHATLEFLEHDPSKLKRRSQQSVMGASSMANTASSDTSHRSYGSIGRPRGASIASSLRDGHHYVSSRPSTTTTTSNTSHVGSREDHIASTLQSLRKSTHPRTGKPVPPPSSTARFPALSRPRSGSVDTGENGGSDSGGARNGASGTRF